MDPAAVPSTPEDPLWALWALGEIEDDALSIPYTFTNDGPPDNDEGSAGVVSHGLNRFTFA
jgi:hypothetical protein